MKKLILMLTVAAGLACRSNSRADIFEPTNPPLTVPAGYSLLSLPPLNFNTTGFPANDGDLIYPFRNNAWEPNFMWIQNYGWASSSPTYLPTLEKREAILFFNASGNAVAINNPYEPSVALWNSAAAWKNDAASLSPAGFHLLGYSGLDGGTFERIIDHLPHFHDYVILSRLVDPATMKYRTTTFANGRWFPEAPVLNAGEGAFFEFGPGNGPAVSVQISGVTPSLVPIDANAHAMEVVLTGRFLRNNSAIHLRKSYNPHIDQTLLPTSSHVSTDERLLQSTFDFSSAEGGDYDVLLNYPDGPSPRLMQKAIRLISPASTCYLTVEGSTVLHNNQHPFNYDVIFQNKTPNPHPKIDIRFYARQVNQSNPNIQIEDLQNYVMPAAGGPTATPGMGGAAWVYKELQMASGDKLSVPLIVNHLKADPYHLAGKLPLHYALEVSWRDSGSGPDSWSDPIWMPTFIVP